MKLRPYQQEAVDAVYEHLRERDDNPCVVIPTAGGKTPVHGHDLPGCRVDLGRPRAGPGPRQGAARADGRQADPVSAPRSGSASTRPASSGATRANR